MVDYESLKKFDSDGMHKVYDRWPQICKESYEANFDGVDFKNVDHIVFAGMGGSGAIGDIFYSILSKTQIHANIVKGYVLPNTVNKNSLVVAISVSGNTSETLTVLESAKNIGCKIICFSSGGKMQEFCNKNKIEYRKIPLIHSPRASFTSFLYSMLKVLESTIPVKKEDVNDSIIQLENLSQKISSSNLNSSNPSLNLAEWISDIPVIYYPLGLQAAAIRFKNSLQENAKSHAITEDVIETCHNGIVSWEKPSNTKPILIEGEDDYIKTKERWAILKQYFETNNIPYREVRSIKGGILAKLINLIYLLDYASIYRAIMLGVNPSPVKSIDFIKKNL